MKFGIGQSVLRVEDQRLITGKGRFTDDVSYPGELHGVTVRSPYAHARINGIDASEALAVPGVVAVYTAADLADYAEMPVMFKADPKANTPRPILAKDTARYVGEPVAFVVAESRDAARDGADLVQVDYDDLPAAGSMEEALAPGAPLVWDSLPGNVAFEWEAGDKAAVEAAFAKAAHVVHTHVFQNRVAPNAMEPRAAIGLVDQENGLTLHVGSQGVTGMRGQLCGVMKIKPDDVRVITYDVGGGFGMKTFLYPEYVLVLHAARLLGRPVKWTGGRSDSFLTDTHGRDLTTGVWLALDADGKFLALKADTLSGLGAYQSPFGTGIQTVAGGRMIGGVYHIPAIHNRVRGVMTNTTPTDAYRGAGRPEACYITERAVDAAAKQLGLAPEEIRRRNLLRPDQLPYPTPLGQNFDVGDFPQVLEKALAAADWAGFPARQAEAKARGRLLGRGLCYYVEVAGMGSTNEFADARVSSDGIVEIAVGTQTNGQGHETAYLQVAVDQLQLPPEQIRIVQGDTSRMNVGNGTGGSRSLYWGGAATHQAANEIIGKGKQLAGQALDSADVEYSAGVFRARGTNRALTLAELAAQFPGQLDTRAKYQIEAPRPMYPNGCHIAEVEVDPETGRMTIPRYSIVDDFGVLLNPMLVQGQVHGGVAQGLGQALLEQVVYGEGAQLMTGSFMDYCMPRADDMPWIDFDNHVVPSPDNPLGVKGCGEAGTIGAVPALMSALADALGQTIESPATPERIWRAANAKLAAE